VKLLFVLNNEKKKEERKIKIGERKGLGKRK